MENAHRHAGTSNKSSSSVENLRRKMLLLEIEENEKSQFEDELTCTISERDFPAWQETEQTVSNTEKEVITTRSDMTSNWDQNTIVETETEKGTENSEDDEKSSPKSFYQLMELNKEPIDQSPRIARVPSQYQLDALSEMFLYDVPQQYTLVKCEKSDLAGNCHNSLQTNPLDADREVDRNGMTPYFVNSEYVSEMLI